MSRAANITRPGTALAPTMVWVLPDPVCPYAKHVALFLGDEIRFIVDRTRTCPSVKMAAEQVNGFSNLWIYAFSVHQFVNLLKATKKCKFKRLTLEIPNQQEA